MAGAGLLIHLDLPMMAIDLPKSLLFEMLGLMDWNRATEEVFESTNKLGQQAFHKLSMKRRVHEMWVTIRKITKEEHDAFILSQNK